MSILNLFNLEGEVAVVTGAGKGIGKGIALALAEAGADVVVASRSEDQLNDVAKEFNAQYSSEVFPIACDVRKIDEVAFIRFASVYRRFEDINEFSEEVEKLSND